MRSASATVGSDQNAARLRSGSHGRSPTAGAARRLRGFWFGSTDLRPVGAFRVVFGLLLVNYFWQLIPHVWEWYSDAGMLPRYLAVQDWPQRTSLLFLFGESWQVAAFLAASVAVSAALAIGYRSRTMAVLAFVALVSVQWRNPLLIDGSDYVYRLVSFWLIFTDLGATLSVDSVLRRAAGLRSYPRGWALPVRLLELQVAWIYAMTALEKLPGHTWFDGTAIYWALQLTHTFSRGFAQPVALSPVASSIMSIGTIAVEISFLPLVFLPAWNQAARNVAIVGAVLLHGGIFVLMNVGNFPIAMISCLILFVSGDRVGRAISAIGHLVARTRTVIYYDKACQLCRATVRSIRAADAFGTVRAVDAGASYRLRATDSSSRPVTGAAALALAARGIPLLYPLAALGRLPGVEGIVEAVYPWAGKRGKLLLSAGGPCELHRHLVVPSRPRAARARRGVVPALLLAGVAVVALSTAIPPYVAAMPLPDPVSQVVSYVSIDQRWNMFSPDPPTSDGWLAIPAQLADGTSFDLLTGGPVSDGPRYADPLFSRWTKGLQAMVFAGRQDLFLEYGRMFCRARNRDLHFGQSPLATFEIVYHEQVTPPPPGGAPTFRQYVMWRHQC